jgi:nucleoside-diphosphate-sugar epimerase
LARIVIGSDDGALVFYSCAAGLLTFVGNQVRRNEHLFSAPTRLFTGRRNAGLKYLAQASCSIEPSQLASTIALNGVGDWTNVRLDQRAGAISLPQDDPKQRRPDIRRARELLNWRPTVVLADGLDRTIAYFSGRTNASEHRVTSDLAYAGVAAE